MKNNQSKQIRRQQAEAILAACQAYSSSLEMEAACSSEISVNYYHNL
jgi:hypothetical protein